MKGLRRRLSGGQRLQLKYRHTKAAIASGSLFPIHVQNSRRRPSLRVLASISPTVFPQQKENREKRRRELGARCVRKEEKFTSWKGIVGTRQFQQTSHLHNADSEIEKWGLHHEVGPRGGTWVFFSMESLSKKEEKRHKLGTKEGESRLVRRGSGSGKTRERSTSCL